MHVSPAKHSYVQESRIFFNTYLLTGNWRQKIHLLSPKNLPPPPNKSRQETAEDGMAGLQSGNKIREEWLRTSLNAMVNLRYCMTLKFEWAKSRSRKRQQNLRRKVYLHVTYCKNIKWPWTGKIKVRVTRKGRISGDLTKVYSHARYQVCTD